MKNKDEREYLTCHSVKRVPERNPIRRLKIVLARVTMYRI